MLRPLVSLCLAAAVPVMAGCGGTGDAASPAAPREPVRLLVSAPLDTGTTRSPTVQVAGTVAPASARVLVMGRRVTVSGGRFSATVDLREGTNVIDVGASASGARPAWRALRVTRRSKVEVPDVVGREASAGKATLEGLGLDVSVVVDDGLFDAFREGPRLVCEADPEAGARVDPGSEVRLVVSKTC